MNVSPFGQLPTGEAVDAYTLANANGFCLTALTYGVTVTALLAPDRNGVLADVVLGFDHLAGYLGKQPYMGAVAGRVAGRLGGARFTLDGRTYPLVANDPPNHLHGGTVGFDKRIWRAEVVERADGEDSVRFSYRSVDGEEGYPGTVDVSVTYTVTAENAFVMETAAVTDHATPFSPTQHSYFNLASEGTIEGHILQVEAEVHVPVDKKMTPLGRREPVAGRGEDFREARKIGEALPEMFKHHGALYSLGCDERRRLRRAARVHDPISGRVLTVSTTEDYLQIYTSSAFDGRLIGKGGRRYAKYSGLCLECEGYPDGANTPELGDIILRPGRAFRQITIYAFSTL